MNCIKFWKILLLSCSLLLLALPAWADFAAKVDALAVGSYKAKTEAVKALAATGDERSVSILEALLDGRLFTRKSDGLLLIGEKQGQVYVLLEPLILAEVDQLPKNMLKKGPF